MLRIPYRGPRDELLRDLYAIPRVFSGKEPDRGGVVEGVMHRMGMVLLGRVKANYVLQAAGGTGDLGTGPWAPLSPVTLALRRRGLLKGSRKRGVKGGEAATYAALKREFAALPQYRKNLIIRQYGGLSILYSEEESRLAKRRHARSILRRMQPSIPAGRYRKLLAELSGPLAPEKAERLAYIGAHAEILRDTGRLLNSLSPELKTPDQVLTASRGVVAVGTNVSYAKYHNSGLPRKLKKDGTPKLPRRQFLPDDAVRIPVHWWQDMTLAVSHALAAPEFWRLYLGAA